MDEVGRSILKTEYFFSLLLLLCFRWTLFFPLLGIAEYEEINKDCEPLSPVRSHILHFYFPSATQLILCCLPAFPAPDFFGPTRISYVRPETRMAGARADWTDLREGRGRLFQTFLWLTNVAMRFLVMG